MSRKGNTLTFRLRKTIDSDLSVALENIDTDAISDLCRDGLRLALGLRTTKRIEIMERPLVAPESGAVQLRSTPAVWTPKQK